MIAFPYSDNIVEGGLMVNLQQTQSGLSAAMLVPSVTIAARAVAVLKPLDNSCILALANNGTRVDVVHTTTLELSGCSAAANSASSDAIVLRSSLHSLTADTLITPGQISFDGSSIDPTMLPPELRVTSPPMIGSYAVKDPYAGILDHAFLSSGISGTRNRPIPGLG